MKKNGLLNVWYYIKSQRPLFAIAIVKIDNVSIKDLDNRLCSRTMLVQFSIHFKCVPKLKFIIRCTSCYVFYQLYEDSENKIIYDNY